MGEAKTKKEQYIENYIKSLYSIEEAIEPFKEQKRELRKEYSDNGWLTKDEIRATIRAYRLHKGGIDIDSIKEVYGQIDRMLGRTISE
tara:strand:- start:1024 stop:1287 length:264 start_codon:yes stop_codon:yes gene_type:complete